MVESGHIRIHSPQSAIDSRPSCYVSPKRKASTLPRAWKSPCPSATKELASQIGTVRELVSRNLSRLQAEGMIKIDGRSVADERAGYFLRRSLDRVTSD